MKQQKRSTLEEVVGDVLEPAGFEYESRRLAYHVPRVYTPDFTYTTCHIEVKGYFRAGDTQKYAAIAHSLEAMGHQLIMVLQTPNKKVRKGSKMTMAEWCNKNDIPWYGLEDLPDLIGDVIDFPDEEEEEEDEEDEDEEF